MLQSSLPTVICDTGFTDRQPEHLPKLVAGVGVAPTEKFMRLLCALVEFPAVNWWSRRVTLPHRACLQGKCIACLPRPHEIGKPPWCCPRQAEFWRLCCTAGARL